MAKIKRLTKAPLVTSENFESLLLKSAAQALEIATGKRAPARKYQLTARETTIADPPKLERRDVIRVRAKLDVSQQVFGKLIGRSGAAVRAWELEGSGKTPDGSASRMIQMLDRHPEYMNELIATTKD